MRNIKILSVIIATFVFCSSNGQNTVNFVDLGLPSGTLWADRNVGASKPEECGNFFAWGEITPKKRYDWSNYKYSVSGDVSSRRGVSVKLSKYVSGKWRAASSVDNLAELEPEDDAATHNLGQEWRMPSHEEMDELLKQCLWFWTSRNGVPGYEVVGSNACKIFIPAAGCIVDGKNSTANKQPALWTSTRKSNDDIVGWHLCHIIINSAQRGNLGLEECARCIGCNIRAVYKNRNGNTAKIEVKNKGSISAKEKPVTSSPQSAQTVDDEQKLLALLFAQSISKQAELEKYVEAANLSLPFSLGKYGSVTKVYLESSYFVYNCVVKDNVIFSTMAGDKEFLKLNMINEWKNDKDEYFTKLLLDCGKGIKYKFIHETHGHIVEIVISKEDLMEIAK